MSPKIKSGLAHGLMACLFSLGLVLTLLGVTGLLRHGFLATWMLLILCGLSTAAGLHRRIGMALGCIGLFAGAVWLLIGGAGMIAEVSRALILHTSGLTAALPMVGVEFTVMACVLCTAISWFVTQRSAGPFPALILLVMAAVLLWLGNWPDVLLCLAPAVIACVTLMLRAGDEHTSTLRVLPLAAAVTAIAFAGVGAGGAVSKPLKELADDIRQRIYDTFFYTQPRDVFTLATEGYYPQGLGQLGGPATPREEPVMAVITPRKVYLRGVVKNIYTGRTWVDDIGGRRYLWSAARFDALRTQTFDMDLPRFSTATASSLLTPVTLQVRMLQDGASTLFVPQRLRQLHMDGELTPYFNVSSEVFATSNLRLGDVWTMDAALFTSMDPEVAALVENASASVDPNWERVCDDYLQLPEHLEARVYDLAVQAAGHAGTPYERALALQRWLAGNYTYTLDAEPQSPEQDFVSTFLLIDRKGYCTYFASAMTVLCRMAGLPARYVEGYVAYPDGEGLAVVTGLDGHAWTEVYFRGFGWVTFDATPTSAEFESRSDDPTGEDEPPASDQTPEPPQEPTHEPTQPPEAPSPSPSQNPEPEQQPQPEASPPPDEQPQPDGNASEASDDSKDSPWKTALCLVLLILLVLRGVLVQPAVQALRADTEFGRWLVWCQATHDALRRLGLRREKAETPAAFFRRIDAGGKLPFSLEELAQAQNLMFYGHAAPYPEEIRLVQERFHDIFRLLNPWQKLIFQLQRICLPARRFDMTAQ